MAGIIKRKNTWYACFRVSGKLKIRTTGIKTCPVTTPGKSKNAAMKEAELQGRLIAEELEKEAKGSLLNVDVIVSLAGDKAKFVLRNKKYMPGVRDHLTQWLETRPNRVCAVQSWLSLGVASSLLAWFIAWLKGQEDDEDDEKKWRKYGITALLGDLTSILLAGEGVNYLASLFTGQRVFADNYARTLIDVGAITHSLKKEYEHLAQKKEMD